MKYSLRLLAIIGIITLSLFRVNASVHAFPPLPSSMYGTVKVNNANVSAGTLVEGLINNQVIAKAYTQTYNNNSVYTLDIPGDDASTTVIEGGKEGDVISFKVGGVLAKETGVWHGATNVELNLTATATTVINTAAPTPSPVPTQTAIVIYPTATSTPLPEPTITNTVASVDTGTTASSIIMPKETGISTPSLTKTAEVESARRNSISLSGIILIVVLVLTALIAGILALRWKKGSK